MEEAMTAKQDAVNKRAPSIGQVLAEQKLQARKSSEAANVPAPIKPMAVAVPDSQGPIQKYLDEIAPAGIAGRLIKFSKEGTFVTADDGETIPEDAEFIALCDETLIGWIKFNRDKDSDAPPERVAGLLFDGFVMPSRESLGDNNQARWEVGLSGAPEDPWQHQNAIVLQNTETRELYTFATTSKTGRRAVGNLLKHYDRMRRDSTNELPVVRLKAGGFNHRDDRIGWVHVPVFVICGRAPRDSAIKPDTSLATNMNDSIPF
jgi:hypothetical protein